MQQENMEMFEKRITEELKTKRAESPASLAASVADGDHLAGRLALLFYLDAGGIDELFSRIDSRAEEVLGTSAREEEQFALLSWYFETALDLRSFLPRYRLLELLGDAALSARASAQLEKLEAYETKAPAAAKKLRDLRFAETVARLKAEGLTAEGAAETEAEKLFGASLAAYVGNIAAEISRSNLMRAASERLSGRSATEVGNDYAVFLEYVLRMGGSFVTTNPVLIKLAWDIRPDYWSARVDEMIAGKYDRSELKSLIDNGGEDLRRAVEAVSTDLTVAVVEENCRLLRGIFLLSGGKTGYVSLQVNPNNHDNADLMVREALHVYELLEKRLGGVPNVVIKVPATAAGLAAAEKLTGAGIGVTVTLTFSAAQARAFGRVITAGKAPVSYIAVMNGRMAFPVRDEFAGRNDEAGVLASQWAGVAAARKAYHLLYDPLDAGGLGADMERLKLMIASLRIYDGWIPDISELWGCPVITVFPNVRRAYDAVPRDFASDAVRKSVPQEESLKLLESEIYRQALWTPEDGPESSPEKPLSLDSASSAALAGWQPVRETLDQFTALYSAMGSGIIERMKTVYSETKIQA